MSVSSGNDKLSGEISIYVSLKPGANLTAVTSQVDAELTRLKRELVTTQELEKLKNQIKLGYVKGLQTMASRAQALALNEVYFNNYKELFEDLAKYEKVTAEDIQRVTKQYVVASRKSTVQISPKAAAGVAQ